MSMKLKDVPFETLMPTIVPVDKVPVSDSELVSGLVPVAVVGAMNLQMLSSTGDYQPVITSGFANGGYETWFFCGQADCAYWAEGACSAGQAYSADWAESAGCADYACWADGACCAGIADSASYADLASSACWADGACYADCACYAGLADYASCAGCANYADCACYACHAGTTDYALWAECADYACSAGQTSWAGCANSACYANCAGRVGCTARGDEATAISAACDGLYFEFNEQGDDGSTQAASKHLSYGEACSLPAGAKVLYFI